MSSLLVGLLAIVLIVVSTGLRVTLYDNYVLLADAFVHGHLWIDWPGVSIDALKFNGRYFVIEAPVPALLLIPAAYFFGKHANETLLASILGGIAVGAAWEIAKRLEVPENSRLILVAFFLVGTDLWWCSMYGDVWFVAHSSAVAFTMLALVELLGKRRSWIVALCAAMAAGSRFNMIAVIPVYMYLLARERTPAQLRRETFAFCAALLPFVVGYLAYNYARWGTPNDIGYTTWYHSDAIGDPTGYPFKLKYVPYELFSFFVRPPRFVSHFPYMQVSNAGVALTWTSPALILALFARSPRYLIASMWAAVALTWIPNLLYYAQGATQFGMRHALDFEPFMLVLMLLAARVDFPAWAAVLCTYSIGFGIWGLWYWRNFWRPYF